MNFSELLQGSRLASLAKPKPSKYFTDTQLFPFNQVVKTTASSFHRRNWGLKAPIPPKHKSVNIIVQELDSDTGLAQYGPGSGDVRRIERFREFGIPVKLPQGIDQDNFFQADSQRTRPIELQSRRELKQLYSRAAELARSFRRRKLDLPARNLTTYDRKRTSDIQEFMGLPKKVPAMSYDNHTAIGLNYSLPGALFNTPHGFREKKEVMGRLVNGIHGSSSGSQVAAIGGFATQTTAADGMLSASDKPKFATPHKFIIQGNNVTGARVELRSTAVSVRSAKDRPYSKSAFYRFY